MGIYLRENTRYLRENALPARAIKQSKEKERESTNVLCDFAP